ncbi:MAG: beta-phosphoglucomutase [Bacteroidetes bacterium]|jgi:beta-phosphoglucomutase|nr:beta-phosphoglucomutase [Bacteroidota bacterium]
MNKTAVIFDLDGVIVDTAKYHYLAWKKLANKLGFDFTHEQNELLKGVSRVKSLEILLNIGDVSLSQQEKQQYMHEKNEHYLSFITQMNESEMLPNMMTILKFLKEKGIAIALGSASKNAKLILDTLQITQYFDEIIDGNEVSKAKPDPEVFILAAHRLNKKPEECIVVEDAAAGIDAANAANMLCIGIGEKEILKEATYVFKSTSELTTEFLDKLIKK